MVEDIGFRFLGAGNFPDHRTISDFRKIHHNELADLFQQVLTLCDVAGLVKMGTVAIDGSKIKANASIDKNFTLETLKKKEKYYTKKAKKILKEGIKVDEEEDRIFGPDNTGSSMPQEALKRIKKAKKQLEKKKEEVLAEYKHKIKERKKQEKRTGKGMRGRKPAQPEEQMKGEKNPVANTTDPDSRIMKTRKGFIQGYNPQIAVDADTHIILSASLTQNHNDRNQLSPVIEETIRNTGRIPDNVTADAGYDNEEQINRFKDIIELYIPTQKGYKQRRLMREQSPPRGRIPNNFTDRQRRERKLLTKKGREVYSKRGSSVEPVFGNIKYGRGLDKLLLRGKKKGHSEWKMYCMGHNILKLWRKMVEKAK